MDAAASRLAAAAALGISFIDLHAVPLKINALSMRNAFLAPHEFGAQVMRHLLFQVCQSSFPAEFLGGLLE